MGLVLVDGEEFEPQVPEMGTGSNLCPRPETGVWNIKSLTVLPYARRETVVARPASVLVPPLSL